MTELLRDYWYVAAHAPALKRGAMLPITMLGEALLLGRGNDGTVFALKDFCPHRGIPLRYGKFNGCEIECCYHGWKFDMAGTCTKIPTLTEDDTTNISKIKTGSYPAFEQDGLIWVYMAADMKNPTPPGPPPAMPASMAGGFRRVESVEFPCDIDHAAVGLMDPSHGPYVHQSWWWRSQKSMHEKQKQFAPVGHGFRMVSHRPSSNSRAYKILGGVPITEIAFQLPGLRTEHITIGKHVIVLLTALTPIDANRTQLHQFIYTSIGWLNLLLPLFRPFGKKFIAQDLRVVQRQQEGLAQPNHPTLLLMGDADQQALWYYRLKKEALSAAQAARPFENPLREKLLRWRS